MVADELVGMLIWIPTARGRKGDGWRGFEREVREKG